MFFIHPMGVTVNGEEVPMATHGTFDTVVEVQYLVLKESADTKPPQVTYPTQRVWRNTSDVASPQILQTLGVCPKLDISMTWYSRCISYLGVRGFCISELFNRWSSETPSMCST